MLALVTGGWIHIVVELLEEVKSVANPLEYYKNNLCNTLMVLSLMKKHGVNKFVFYLSATVYGDPHACTIIEDFTLSIKNSYRVTKLMI